MISLTEQKSSFNQINQELQSKSLELISQLKAMNLPFETKSNSDLQAKGIIADSLYYIKSGNVAIEQDDKELFLLENGDVFIYLSLEKYEQSELYFSEKYEAEIEILGLETLYIALSNKPSLISLLITVKTLSQLQLMQMIGALTQIDEKAAPGFKRFDAGDIIINEGDDADYVYSVTSGTAEATHNGVHVGDILNDEIFGAIAVLTDQKRTATVTAKTSCTVLMVHKDEFQKMAHSHPHIFISVLQSLASNIITLNEKVSSLSKKQTKS